MSVTFSSKSEVVMGDGLEPKSTYEGRFPKSVWWVGAVAVCLGLLSLFLLGVVIAMVGQYIEPSPLKDTELPIGPTTCDNLTSQCFLWQGTYYTSLENYNHSETKHSILTKEKETVKGERDALKNETATLQTKRDILKSETDRLQIQQENLKNETATLQTQQNNLKNEIATLQTQQNNLKSETDTLQTQQNNLKSETATLQTQQNNLKRETATLQTQQNNLRSETATLQSKRDTLRRETENECPENWEKINNKCYYHSKYEQYQTWTSSRNDCKNRGGDLAIVSSDEDHDVLLKFASVVWIGLSDKAQRGRWKWVNGKPLTSKGFWSGQGPTNERISTCVALGRYWGRKSWTNMRCDEKHAWVCEA